MLVRVVMWEVWFREYSQMNGNVVELLGGFQLSDDWDSPALLLYFTISVKSSIIITYLDLNIFI